MPPLPVRTIEEADRWLEWFEAHTAARGELPKLKPFMAALGYRQSTYQSWFLRAGVRPYRVLASLRLLRALRDLKRGDTVTAVAYRYGYSSPQTFGRTCRQVLGASPTRALA